MNPKLRGHNGFILSQDDREAAEEDGSIENDKQCAAAKARQRHLLSEKKRLSGDQQRVTMDEQVAFKERVDNLQVKLPSC
jgi:hypothetical protein